MKEQEQSHSAGAAREGDITSGEQLALSALDDLCDEAQGNGNSLAWVNEQAALIRAAFPSCAATTATQALPAIDLDRERADFERIERASDLKRDDDCPEDYANPCVQSAWEGWAARALIDQARAAQPSTPTSAQITAGAAVLGDDGKPIGRNTAIMVADAMGVAAQAAVPVVAALDELSTLDANPLYEALKLALGNLARHDHKEAERIGALARAAASQAAPVVGASDELNNMRIALTVQIDELIDIASAYEVKMEHVGDFDEAQRIRGAVAYARKVAAPYKYNGPLRVAPTATAATTSKDARDAALKTARDALNGLLWQFTGTPSTLRDSNARAQGHAAIAAIDSAMRATQQEGGE